jgi:hypothetical protein
MTTIRSSEGHGSAETVECETRPAPPRHDRAEPAWPGFRAARLITLTKMRGEARAALLLALLIIAATAAVIGAPHLGDAARELGAALGIGLRASEIVR